MRAKIFLNIFILLLILSAFSYASDILVAPKVIKQGSTFTVEFTPDKPAAKVSAIFAGQTVPFYKMGNDRRYLGIFGVSATCPSGYRQIQIIATAESGDAEKYTETIVVGRAKFPFEKLLFIPKTKKAKISQAKISNDQEEISKIFTMESEAKLWEGKFLLPVKGRVTSAYGTYRLYNGKRIGDHRGLDIGSTPIGTRIKAANNGAVAFVKFMPTLGAVIILDHGLGIHTIYMHMSKTLVKVGDKVKKGQIIGLVGNTGISTGPHLHWGLSVHDTRVNPLDWTRRMIIN